VPELGRTPGLANDCPQKETGQSLLLETQNYTRENLTPVVLENLSRGQLVWSYTGHANKNQITTEGLLIHRPTFSISFQDMRRINNVGRPFIFHGFACHLNEFEHVNEGRNGESIGEVLLLSATGGSIASVASSGYEWAHLNDDSQIAVTSTLFWDIPRDPVTGRPMRLLSHATYSGLIQLALDNAFNSQHLELMRTYVVLGDPALRIDFAVPWFEVTRDGEPVDAGSPLTAVSLQEPVAFEAEVGDDADLGTIAVYDGERRLDASELTITLPSDEETGARMATVVFTTTLRLGSYDIRIEAEDWAGRMSSVALPVRFESAFASMATCFAGEEAGGIRPLSPSGGNRIDAGEAIQAVVQSPVPLVPENLRAEIDGAVIEEARVEPVDDEGYFWRVEADRIWEEGEHVFGVRAERDGQAVVRTVPFEVSGGSLQLEGRPFFYPNPAERGAGALHFEITRGARSGQVTVYTVRGRRVLRTPVNCNAGRNSFSWDLTDDTGDAVANGVYLFVLDLEGFDGERVRHLEKVAVSR
jgi:hypothetical protein